MKLFVMYFFIAVIIISMLRNPAASTGIIVGIGDAGTKFTNALVGGTSGAKGTIKSSAGSTFSY